ncbi:MAG: metallophosphoesterase family protein [Hyphomicrobiaceae bacterium]|nr:metallophosphoesterase family protein [Hyphomicrobiaceae bacterium]MCC0024861.1 metallophosphoesterase family protein [Hyphomicrobiaceae bacterium]
MRFAAISDIHGNAPALEAVLDDIDHQHVDFAVNLGDAVSGPIAPARTADILIAHDLPTIAGNHEQKLLTRPAEKLGKTDQLAASQLTETHYEWLRILPPTLELAPDVFACHGTPASNNVFWLDSPSKKGHMRLRPLEFIEAELNGVRHSLILCGHTHTARSVSLSTGQTVVNPGSVGLVAFGGAEGKARVSPGSPHARYAIIEQQRGQCTVSFRLVPYDWDEAARLAELNGAPDWAGWIRTGRAD